MEEIIVFTHPDCLIKDNGLNHPEKKERLEIVLKSIKEISSIDIEIKEIFDENDKFVLLLDLENNLSLIKSKLNSTMASKYKFCVVSNLSLPDQKILDVPFKDFDKIEEESLSILIVTRISN